MIIEVPEWARTHIRKTKKLTIAGICCGYCEVASDLGTGNGFPEIFTIHSGGFFAVSEAYPAEWQELGVAHEFIEHTLLSAIDESDRCLTALQIELALAENSKLNMLEYVEFRYSFFDRLITAYSRKGTLTSAEKTLVSRLKRSRGYLQDRLYDLRGE